MSGATLPRWRQLRSARVAILVSVWNLTMLVCVFEVAEAGNGSGIARGRGSRARGARPRCGAQGAARGGAGRYRFHPWRQSAFWILLIRPLPKFALYFNFISHITHVHDILPLLSNTSHKMNWIYSTRRRMYRLLFTFWFKLVLLETVNFVTAYKSVSL